MSVIDEIRAERERQISEEGWSPQHDAAHKQGELAGAAACYALRDLNIQNEDLRRQADRLVDDLWPWAPFWWKPTSRRRNLVRAAALLVAEIERLDRAEALRISGAP